MADKIGSEYYQSMASSEMFQLDPSGNIAKEIDTFKELVPNASDRQAIAVIILFSGALRVAYIF